MKRAGLDGLKEPISGRGEPQWGARGDEACVDPPVSQCRVEVTGVLNAPPGFANKPSAVKVVVRFSQGRHRGSL